MAGDNIGKLSVQISANATSFEQTVSGLTKHLTAFSGTVQTVLGGAGQVAGSLGKVLSGNIGAGVGGLLEQFKGLPPGLREGLMLIPEYGPALAAVADGLGMVKDATLGATQAFIDMGERGLSRIREQARLSRMFGTSLGSAAGLQMLSAQTGQDPHAMAAAMQRLGRAMTSARNGAAEMQERFAYLGVSTEMIRRGDTAAVLGRIAQQVQATGDAAQNGAALYSIFGRQVATVTPLLYSEGDALDEAAARAQRFGLVVSQSEASAVSAANRARQRMAADWAALFQGLETRAGVALAPAWRQIAEGARKIIDTAQPAFEGLRDIIDEAGKLVRWFSEGFNAGLDKYLPALDQASRAWQDIATVVQMLVSGSENVQENFTGAGESAAQLLAGGLKLSAMFALDLLGTGLTIYQTFRDTVAAVDSLINGIREAYRVSRQSAANLASLDLTGVAGGLVGQLPEQIGEASDMAGRLRDLSRELVRVAEARNALDRPGRSPLEIQMDHAIRRATDAVRAASQQGVGNFVDGLDAIAFSGVMRNLEQQRQQVLMTASTYHDWQLQMQGASVEQRILADDAFRSLQRTQAELANLTPIQGFAREIERLNELWFDAEGGIQGYSAALMAAFQQMEGRLGADQSRNPAGANRGTLEALQAVQRFGNQEREDNPQQRVERALARAEDVQRRQLEVQQAMLRALAENGISVLDIPPGGE